MKLWSEWHNDCAQVGCEQAAALPDYYPPIQRVVRAEGQPCITQVREQDGVVSVSGEVALVLLYQTEDEKGLCSYRTVVPFSQSFSLPEGGAGACDARAGAALVTCRITAPRRVAFKAQLPVYLTVSGEKPLRGPEPQADMLYHIQSVEGRCGLGCATRRFHLTEKGECDRMPAAALHSCAAVCVTEVSAAGGKTLVKGELSVRTLFVTRDDEVGMVRYVFPVSQLLDLPSGEGIDVEAVFTVGQVETECGETMDGSKGRFSYEIDLSVSACASESRRCELVCDAFSTTHALDCTRESTLLSALVERCRGSVDVTLSIPDDPEGGMLIDTTAALLSVSGKADGKILQMEGECALCLLCLEDSGRIRARELTLPFTASIPCKKQGRVTWQVCVWSALPVPDGVRMSLRYEAAVWQDTVCEHLCTAIPDPSRPLPPHTRYPVTVYFADKGELLWDIAKKYRISPNRIRECNGLEGEEITQARRLLIL